MPYRVQRDHADAWILAVAPIPTGLVIALFSERFTQPAWRFAGGMPGGYAMWSGVLLVCGVLMLAAMIADQIKQRDQAAILLISGMAITGLWWFTLGVLFLITAIRDPLANPMGVVAWWLICSFYWSYSWYERRRL